MQGWIEGLQASIDYIERNLCDALDIEAIAGKAALSSFYKTPTRWRSEAPFPELW